MDVSFELTQEYPADLGRLWSTLGQRDYIERKYKALGATALHIQVIDVSPRRIEVRLMRDARIEKSSLPAWGRWLGGRRRRVQQHSRWLRRSDQTVEVSLESAVPSERVRATGTGEAVQVGSSVTRLTLQFTVRCELPVIAASVAEVFARQVRMALAEDHAFTVAFLGKSTSGQPNS